MSKVGRNAPCPCGSGKKHKHCCLNKERAMPIRQKLVLAVAAIMLLGGLVATIVAYRTAEPGAGSQRVWSEEHQHWHNAP